MRFLRPELMSLVLRFFPLDFQRRWNLYWNMRRPTALQRRAKLLRRRVKNLTQHSVRR